MTNLQNLTLRLTENNLGNSPDIFTILGDSIR